MDTLFLKDDNWEAKPDESLVYAALIRSLSHDLRNPLSAIIQAASFYLSEAASLDEKKKASLVEAILQDSSRLLELFENMLIISNIYETPTPFSVQTEVLDEILSAAFSRIKAKFPKAQIQSEIPAEILLISADGILIKQVILLLTAILLTTRKTEYPLLYRCFKKGDFAVFYLESPNVETTSVESVDLTVCKLIIAAHKGSFSQSAQSCSRAFTFTLPLGGPT